MLTLVITAAPLSTITPTVPTPTPGPIHISNDGAVHRPGNYTLPSGSLVDDAVRAADGPTADAAREPDTAIEIQMRIGHKQTEGLTRAYRALRALLMGDAKAALNAACKARELANVEHVKADIIEGEWLLGAAHRRRNNYGAQNRQDRKA